MLVADREPNRGIPWPPCKYRRLFNTGATTLNVCREEDACSTYGLKPPETNNVDQFLISLNVGVIPDSYTCLSCIYRKEDDSLR